MDDRSVLTKMVEVAMDSLALAKMFQSAGYDNSPYFDIHGKVADAIYCMLGENTDTFDESVTGLVLASNKITNAQRVDILSHHYRKNQEAMV